MLHIPKRCARICSQKVQKNALKQLLENTITITIQLKLFILITIKNNKLNKGNNWWDNAYLLPLNHKMSLYNKTECY